MASLAGEQKALQSLQPATESSAKSSIGRRRAQSLEGKEENTNSRKESLSSALIRAILPLFFRLPIRLFRPVKLSSWTVLETYAKREKKQLSPSYLWALLRREQRFFIFHLLGPPILFNTIIGFVLFEGYMIAEAQLLKKFRPELLDRNSEDQKTKWTPLWIVLVAGGVGGFSQSLLSSPLDNVKLVLSQPRQSIRRRGRRGHLKPKSQISWRSVMKAAILPFSPSDNQYRRMIRSVQDAQAKKAGQAAAEGAASSIFAKEQRKAWEQKIKVLSKGMHGSGLAMSLARDTVGFASFFFIFEISRRCALKSSMMVDRTIAWFSASAPLPPSAVGSVEVSSSHDDEASSSKRKVDLDFSYNASKTKTGRLTAAFVLIVGGGVGALIYEMVGRPFELMRIIVWQGRQQWQKERANQTRAAHGGRSLRHRRFKSPTEAAQAAVDTSSSRLESLLTLRSANSAGTRTSRLETLLSYRQAPHPIRRLVSKADRTAVTSTSPTSSVKAAKPQAASFARRPVNPNISVSHRSKSHVSRRPPSALSLLLKHAEQTSTLAYTSSSHKFRTAVPHSVLLLHTYFIAPYLTPLAVGIGRGSSSFPTVASGSSLSERGAASSASAASAGQGASSSTSAASASGESTISSTTRSAAKLLSKWTNNNPVASSWLATNPKRPVGDLPTSSSPAGSASQGAASGLSHFPPPRSPTSIPRVDAESLRVRLNDFATRFGSTRSAWVLRRLATPYGVAFVVFAWMSGDV